jgi:hypothetical protein
MRPLVNGPASSPLIIAQKYDSDPWLLLRIDPWTIEKNGWQ